MRPAATTLAPANPESPSLLGVLLVPGGPASPRTVMPFARDIAVPAAVWTAPTPWAALQLIRRRPGAFGLAIVCDDLGDVDPLDFLRRLRREAPGMPALIVSAEGWGAVFVPPEGPRDSVNVHAIHNVWRRLRGR